MDFATKAHKEIYDRVGEWMKEFFGMLSDPMPDRTAFLFHQGDTLTQVIILPWSTDDAAITCRSYVVLDVEMSPELMHFLLTENASFRFGAFGLDNDDDIFFEHTIVGSTCDPEELKASVLAVANVSDRYAEKIIATYGGVRHIDKMRAGAAAR